MNVVDEAVFAHAASQPSNRYIVTVSGLFDKATGRTRPFELQDHVLHDSWKRPALPYFPDDAAVTIEQARYLARPIEQDFLDECREA
eukprot:4769238-Pleurochrysis_carterae.AAC.1